MNYLYILMAIFCTVLAQAKSKKDAKQIENLNLQIAKQSPEEKIVKEYPQQPPEGLEPIKYKPYSEEAADLYIWRENNTIWMHAIARTQEVFICGPNFFVMQNKKFLSGVKLEPENDLSYCEHLKNKVTLSIKIWRFKDHQVDWSQEHQLLAEPTFLDKNNSGLRVEMQ